MEIGFWGRPAILRVIWWGQRVPGAPGGGRRLRKFLPVVQVSAGEGNTMATRPASITFSTTISQISWFPLSLPLPCGPGPSPTTAVSPVLSHFWEAGTVWRERMCPCRPLASGHGTLAAPPEESCPRSLSTRSWSLGMLALRFSQAIFVTRLAFYIETMGWDLPGSQTAESQGRLGWGLSAFLAAWRGSPWLRGVGTPTEGMVDRGHSDPSALARRLCSEDSGRPSSGPAQLWGWCTWRGRVDASDDQSWLWGAGDCPSWPAQDSLGSQISLELCFSWELFLHIYISLSVHECEGVAVMFSVKKKRKSKNNKALCMASATLGQSLCSSHLGLSFSRL